LSRYSDQLAALKEPNMNNPRRQPGVEQLLIFNSSEGAEYNCYGKNFSLTVIPYSRRSILYSPSNIFYDFPVDS
jgi:hypothetical protein